MPDSKRSRMHIWRSPAAAGGKKKLDSGFHNLKVIYDRNDENGVMPLKNGIQEIEKD
jgi:hypothetical protein